MPEIPVSNTSKPIRLSTSVECSRITAEQLRLAALDGLLALPRVGMGVGGLLLGTRVSDQIRILEAVEIPCGHSAGPSFALTDAEVAHAMDLVAKAAPLQVVGWYCSKTRGASVLSEQAAGLFRTLCPESWQVMLLLRPSTVEPSRAVLFVRDPGGNVVIGGEQDLDPAKQADPEKQDKDHLPARDTSAPSRDRPYNGGASHREMPTAEPPVNEQLLPPLPALGSLPSPKAAHPLLAVLNPPRTAPLEDAVTERIAPSVPMSPVAAPRFLVAPAPNGMRRWLPWVLAAAISAGGATAWITRAEWMPRPELTLSAVDLNGHLSIRWNVDAVRGSNTGVLSVNDGGDLHSYPLDRHLLEAGSMGYDRKSARVTATLRVGETRAIYLFLDPAAPILSDKPASDKPPSDKASAMAKDQEDQGLVAPPAEYQKPGKQKKKK